MKGGRSLFTCPGCGKSFFYWVQEGVAQPKVRCYFCGAETFPNGEPPAAPAPPAPATGAGAQPPTPPAQVTAPPASKPAAAAQPAEGASSPST
jgi:hypothetical protein